MKGITSEAAIGAGVALLAAAIAAGVAILLGGRAAGGIKRGQRHGEGPPEPGKVPSSRHQGQSAASAR
jgi:hypothetical protein